jgi:hypothetical protein
MKKKNYLTLFSILEKNATFQLRVLAFSQTSIYFYGRRRMLLLRIGWKKTNSSSYNWKKKNDVVVL